MYINIEKNTDKLDISPQQKHATEVECLARNPGIPEEDKCGMAEEDTCMAEEDMYIAEAGWSMFLSKKLEDVQTAQGLDGLK